MSRARPPLRYLGWHLRDIATGPLALYVAIATMLTVVVWRFLQNRPDIVSGPETFITGTLSVVQVVAVLFAAGGVAGVDIHRGFYRAWFAKPVSPWQFYFQRWLLGGAAFLLVPVLLSLGMALVFRDAPWLPAGLLGTWALGYLLIGSLVLLASVFTERDWLLAFLVTFAQAQLHRVVGFMEMMDQEVSPALRLLDEWLPPFHLVKPAEELLSGRDLWHVVAYGGVMLLAALLLFRHRPLGSGGRA